MSPAGSAMEIAVAGAADISRYGRRIVRMLWDPEPTNNIRDNQPVWCLGQSYKIEPPGRNKSPPAHEEPSPTAIPSDTGCPTAPPMAAAPDTPPDSIPSSFSSSLAYDEDRVGDGSGWPSAFIDDFESRFWMTYRSGFKPIARSVDPKASAAMSFATRLKTLGDQTGFSSDSGGGA